MPGDLFMATAGATKVFPKQSRRARTLLYSEEKNTGRRGLAPNLRNVDLGIVRGSERILAGQLRSASYMLETVCNTLSLIYGFQASLFLANVSKRRNLNRTSPRGWTLDKPLQSIQFPATVAANSYARNTS